MLGDLLSERYEITQKLADDPWSQTYLAKDTKRVGQSYCIVKQLNPQNSSPKSVETTFGLFQEQAELLKNLVSCDRIPQQSLCQENGQFYLIREFIEGQPLLDQLLPGHPVPEKQAIDLLVELLELLEFIHSYQLIHGNIHPNNIIRRNQDKQLVLIDFSPVPQIVPKIPGYQPPEQTLGNPTFSSDVYAVGIITIQALAGIPAQQLPRHPQNHNIIWQDKVTVSRRLASILNKMVSGKPKQRYFSTSQALTDVKKLQAKYLYNRSNQKELMPSVPRDSRGYSFKKWLDHQKILLGLFGLLLGVSATTFLILNESALYFLLRPKLLLANRIGEQNILDVELDIVTFDNSLSDRLIPDVAEKVDRIAAGITVRIDGNKNHQGSGVIIGRNGNIYYVLTAKHVVSKKSDYLVVTADGKSHGVEDDNVRKLSGFDLGVLQFTSEESYSVATLGNYELKYDEIRWVFLSGWPILPKDNSPQREFNAGKVFSREFWLLNITDATSLSRGYELLYTNFSQAGISGGPVLDTEGRVIGIHGASRVDDVSKVQLGESLGVLIHRFLGVVHLAGIPSEYLKVETLPASELTSEENLDSQIPNVFSLKEPNQAENYRHWVNYGNQLWRMGFNEAAIKAFDRAIQIQSNFYPAWYLRGLALKQEKKYSEALISLDRAIKIHPKLYQVWQERGEIFARLGDYPQALKSIDRAIELNSDNFVFHWLRGNWLYRSQRYVKAIKYYGKAININPHPFAYYNRGVASYSLKDYSGAIADYNRAMQMGFQPGEIYQSRGLAYFAQGNRQIAIKNLEKARELLCQTSTDTSTDNCQKLQKTLKTITQSS